MDTSDRSVCTARGRFELALTRAGEVVYREKIENLITSAGENLFAARMLFSGAALTPRYIGFGSGGAAAAKTQTALVAEFAFARVGAGGGSLATANILHLEFTYVPAGSMSGVVEVGVFDANAAGNMVSRAVVSAFTMTPTDSLAIVWELEFLGV